MKRVVITGLGAVTPIGNNVEDFWKGIKESKCGIDEITHFDTTNFIVKLAAEVKNIDIEQILGKKQTKRLDRYTQLAMVASRELMQDSNIDIKQIDSTRFGISLASGIGGLTTIQECTTVLNEKGPDRVSPMFIPMSITNMAAGNVAIDLGLKGESFCLTTACASATHSIGEAFRIIRHGYQDIMIAGGSEASINEVGIAGFTNIKALHIGKDKNRASIPFDKERCGFVMGEGAGVILLEELEHAKQRGAKIYAEIVGYGATSDAYHITTPCPDGDGAARAMTVAMKDADITPDKITYINAHGTSTHLNDAGETLAVKKAFGQSANKVAISSTKGNTGHLLGAAGGVEAIVCIKAIAEGIIPPTINYKVPDEECDLDIVPNIPRKQKVEYAMSNSLGFGGHNSCIIFKEYAE